MRRTPSSPHLLCKDIIPGQLHSSFRQACDSKGFSESGYLGALEWPYLYYFVRVPPDRPHPSLDGEGFQPHFLVKGIILSDLSLSSLNIVILYSDRVPGICKLQNSNVIDLGEYTRKTNPKIYKPSSSCSSR